MFLFDMFDWAAEAGCENVTEGEGCKEVEEGACRTATE
jgi:hypothetical protein